MQVGLPCPSNAERPVFSKTPIVAQFQMLERCTKDGGVSGDKGRTNHAPIGFCMKELKSRSPVPFQSGIIGSLGFIAMVSIIMFWS